MGNTRPQEKNSFVVADFYLVISLLPIQIKSDTETKCIMAGTLYYKILQCFNFVDKFIKIFINSSLATLEISFHHILPKDFST